MVSIGIYTKAVIEATKSTSLYRVGAIIFKGKRIISVGHNYSMRSASKLHPNKQKYPGSIHAEMSAILKARRSLKGYSILVIRLSKNDEIRLAKPCKWCMNYLKAVGINKLYYSTNTGEIYHEKIRV